MAPITPRPSLISPTFQYPLSLCFATTFTTYVLSLITGNVSQVDRLWTFLPTIYSAYWALLPLWPNENRGPGWLAPYVPKSVQGEVVEEYHPRALLMLGLMTLWTFRLSYNTWRRGLFNLSDEDYRWAVLRTQVPPWLFQVINLSFIAIIQNILLLLLAFPVQRALSTPRELGLSDYILSITSLALLTIEFTADNQQFAYHAWKHSKSLTAGQGYDRSAEWPGARLDWNEADRKRGFCTRGLWAWSRHPNFWCEQSFWLVITLFPLLAAPSSIKSRSDSTLATALNALIPLAPSISLCLLFVSSTFFTEGISMSKYPKGYGAYRKRVAMFVPWMTPVWTILLRLMEGQEGVEKAEHLVWGAGAEEGEKARAKEE